MGFVKNAQIVWLDILSCSRAKTRSLPSVSMLMITRSLFPQRVSHLNPAADDPEVQAEKRL